MDKHLTTPADCRESDNEWQEKTLQPFLRRAPERLPQFTSLSGTTVKRLYTPADTRPRFSARDRLPRPASLYSRYSPYHVPRQALDYAPVQRIRYA